MRTGTANFRAESAPASRRSWLLGPAAAAVAGLGLLLASSKSIAPEAPGPDAGVLPDVPLLTHDGKSVRFYSDLVRNRIVFINMIYAQCTERCPPMTQNLKRVHALLGERAGRDIFMYSISLQPEFDRPQELREYMKVNQVTGRGWTFLTGEKGNVERVRRSLGFFERDPDLDGDITQHTGMLRIGNDTLKRWCMTPALLQPDLIVETLMGIDPVARAAGRA
jgi:protein SCO1/2